MKLIADANVFLSAVLGGRVLQLPQVDEVLTTEATLGAMAASL